MSIEFIEMCNAFSLIFLVKVSVSMFQYVFQVQNILNNLRKNTSHNPEETFYFIYTEAHYIIFVHVLIIICF